MDSKSIGLCPQGFESPRCRLFVSSPVRRAQIYPAMHASRRAAQHFARIAPGSVFALVLARARAVGLDAPRLAPGCLWGARLLRQRLLEGVPPRPPWPNGQGVGPLIRRLRVRVPQGVFVRPCLLDARFPGNGPRGVTVSTLDSESSDRGSNPREALFFKPPAPPSAQRRPVLARWALAKNVGRGWAAVANVRTRTAHWGRHAVLQLAVHV